FKAIAFKVTTGVGQICGMRFGLDHVLVAWHPSERLSQIDVRAVLICDIEEANTVLESVPNDAGEALDAQPRLIACLATADAAGTHADQRNRNSGLAQGDRIGGAFGKGEAGASGNSGSRRHHRGRRSGGFDHEVAPREVGCHDVSYYGQWSVVS